MARKYYKTRKEAVVAAAKTGDSSIHAWRMPKGSRKAGQYMVGDYMSYLNTY